MGIRQAIGCGLAKARSLANNLDCPGAHPDRHARDIAANKAILRATLEAALKMDHLTVPAIKAKDPVGFLDDKPALDIGERLAVLLAVLHSVLIERRGQLLELMVGKTHRVETTI